MITEVVLLALLGAATSTLEERRCDPEPRRVTPTVCSNYQNTVFLDDCRKTLEEKQELLEGKIDAMEAELTSTNRELETKAEVAPQIAFSASLALNEEIYRGPSTDKILVYRRVFSNMGNAYNDNTGIFTPPVEGLYYFSFSTYGYNTHLTGAILMKNGRRQISTYEHSSGDGSDSSGGSVILHLRTTDQVYMELWDGARVFDNWNGHTTFSGFLLFVM